ncbi:DUF317 domain-containing protein [Streptomyces sp. NPDC093149]|uniref:DUF317 domain-containing protein n=1 Tax=Streptomyces sp. NPDC093149 TaxID=3366031 RepID=UPI0037F60AB0
MGSYGSPGTRWPGGPGIQRRPPRPRDGAQHSGSPLASAGRTRGWSRWYATASTHTPTELVTAITSAVSDPAPLLRWQQQMSGTLRRHAQLTPVTPPRPPAPTPLDVVRRNAERRPPSLGTVSVPRWSTSTQPATPAPTTPVSRSTPRR